ncbi:adenosylmethionine decarboxylase [Thalassotalea castellviae]|uniref:Adenosylmethionine decarboxylase n=1 Tax=Thalassotalea castellviae TaxID=3075612 RepID=A0ABU3A3G6_9GAMM|nr:adenosylmethionine decarboxylase [Thalassotalea sp. W431]MDT0604716.1 adenosylmethionine decarboxylase [Thalassotalea sp. W431]
MFFEGSEKKAEVVINKNSFSLLNDISDDFWLQLVACCNAKVLSSIKNENCKAFILSESSLFIWEDRFLILTCGITQLVYSIEYFIKHINAKDILHVTYQRKNEYYSNAQLSSFSDDIELLSKYVKGKAYRFGEMYSHHNYVFHQDNQYQVPPDDISYELLAYQIGESASKFLTNKGLTASDVRAFFCVDELLPDFQLDDFVFDPYGYSLNAISDKDYFTIHITPQTDSSYVSIESSLDLVSLAPKIIEILSPASFDLLGFNDHHFVEKIAENISENYVSNSLVSKILDNGNHVFFTNFITPKTQYTSPIRLDINGKIQVI